MSERAYTVAEIDALRDLCRQKWMWGEFFPHGNRASRSYKSEEKDIGVEQLVRTYMLAGITAEQIRAEFENAMLAERAKP